MARHYKNAEAVLPKDVLDAVSEALGGRSAFLWVAARTYRRPGHVTGYRGF